MERARTGSLAIDELHHSQGRDRHGRSGGDLTRSLQAKVGRARDQLSVFRAHPGTVEPTNNGSERLPRQSMIQRKVASGYHTMWAAEGKAPIRTVVDTARLTGARPFGTILKTVGA